MAVSRIRCNIQCSLNRNSRGLITDLSTQPLKPRDVAEILQQVNPDVVLLNEFDYDEDGASSFRTTTSVSQNGAAP